MDYKNKFQNTLKSVATKTIIRTLLLVLFVFSIAIFVGETINSEIQAKNNLKDVSNSFESLYDSNYDFLNDLSLDQSLHSLINESNPYPFQNVFNRFNQNQDVQSNVIIFDSNANIIYKSNLSDEINYPNYLKAIINRLDGEDDSIIYQTFYKPYENYSNLFFFKKIQGTDGTLGYIATEVSGADWSYYALSNFRHDSIVTDSYNNIIFYNRPNLVSNQYTFSMENNWRQKNINNLNYWTVENEINRHDNFIVYSLLYKPRNQGFFILFFTIGAMGVLWYKSTTNLTNMMAEKSSRSVSELVSEINKIKKDNILKRIAINTQDEYQYIGEEINALLDSIQTLNEKNTELLKLSNTIEIANLTAQFNPHFLYNTLEIIRNYIYFDQDKAENLIVKLTSVLKYSIDNSQNEVTLIKDLNYIQDYIEIQKSRFQERLEVVFDIDPKSNNYIIPKLVLQPLLENSLKYGFNVKRNIKIEIISRVVDGNLYLTVKDNGLGMSRQRAQEINQRLIKATNETNSNGLYNIARRLQIQFSPESGLTIENFEGEGLTVLVRVDQQNFKESE